MFIIKERYLEVPNFQNWTEGLYLVDAPCGTGKSYFVFHTLYPFAKENNKKLIVFSNRNALKRQQELQAEGTDIELITYQKLEYTITLYFLRNISSIAARYGKLQKEIQLGNEYLFEREHDVDRFRKVHIKDKLPDFFDNAFGLIEPTWFKAKADYQFYYSLVGAKTPDKGKTTFAKEVSQRLKVRVHYYETVSKNYNLYQLHMSKQAIYDQLTSSYGEGFPADAAQYAVDNMTGVDWNANALEKAKQYYYDMAMSKSAVYDQLTSSYGEQFTASQAQYAIDHLD